MIGLVVAFMFMGIGYSLLSRKLEITGVNKSNGSWDVHFGDITSTTTGKAVSRNVVKDNDSLKASFVVDLYEAGDSAQYSIVVVNDGSVPAKLSDVQTSVSNASEFINMTTTALKNTIIQPNSTYTFNVNIEVDTSSGLELTDVIGSKYTIILDFIQNT